jgi:hypothetical protein
MRFPARHPLILFVASVASLPACATQWIEHESAIRITDTPRPEGKPIECPIDHYFSDAKVPGHVDIAEIDVTCLDGRSRDDHRRHGTTGESECWSRVRELACWRGADFIHETRETRGDGHVRIVTTAAVIGARHDRAVRRPESDIREVW